jgi:hypothetical protein
MILIWTFISTFTSEYMHSQMCFYIGGTLVLHIAASELHRICLDNKAIHLLSDMSGVHKESDQRPRLDPLSRV